MTLSMTPDQLREIVEELESVANFIENEEPEIAVELEQEKEFDLGEFGYHRMDVTLQTDYYCIGMKRIWDDHAPNYGRNFEEHASKLGELADSIEAIDEEGKKLPMERLEEVLDALAESENEDEQALANTLGLVLALYDRLRLKPTVVAGTPVPAFGPPPLPTTPLPWPGALREDIDYIDPEFPLRYQPPPGFDWANEYESRVDHTATVRRAAVAIHGTMHLDHLGRVAFRELGPDPNIDGDRILLWHLERDGLPKAHGFSMDTPPRALDEDGQIMSEDHTYGTSYEDANYNWGNSGITGGNAFTRLKEIRAAIGVPPEFVPAPTPSATEFAPPAEVSL